MEHSLHHKIKVERAMAPITTTSATTSNGVIVDTAGHESCEFVVLTGTVAASAAATFTIQESDASNLAGATTVSAEETLGSITLTATSDDGEFRMGSIGKKRYQRISMITTHAASTEIEGAVCILGHPKNAPVAEQSG
tara:strand:- start:1232 stop:1645 length:414 start_codon:yes stop_codon:yes gene_type:complete